MWKLDPFGTPLDDAEGAREELRRRAWLAISDGLRQGRDVRHHHVRLRNENGEVVFKGTLAQAVATDHPQLRLPPSKTEEAVADTSRRMLLEIRFNKQRTARALAAFSRALSELNDEVQAAKRLVSGLKVSVG